MLNPYATFLGDRDPLTVIAETPGRLSELASAPATAPPPGKWDVRQILCHLADCEITFAFRLRQAVAEEHHTIQPFDQDRWAAAYAAYDVAGALAVFRALREWNLRFLSMQPPAVQEKLVTHPERGTMPFRVLIETMAGHDVNHLRQIERLTQSASAVA
jgi:DinB superfamily